MIDLSGSGRWGASHTESGESHKRGKLPWECNGQRHVPPGRRSTNNRIIQEGQDGHACAKVKEVLATEKEI